MTVTAEAGTEGYVRPEPPRPPPRRAMAGVALALVLTLVGGVAALVGLKGRSGAEDPAAAVRQLFDAAANEDVLGMMDVLVPPERDLLRDRVVELAAQLRRLGLLDERLELADVPGVDVEVENLELRTEPLSSDVVSVVVTGGIARLGVQGGQLPLGPVARQLLDEPPELIPSPAPAELGGDRLRLVTVRRDGQWFVSLGYSAAEAARRSSRAPVPQFGGRISRRGASSPEEAVRRLARAGTDLDARAALALLAPGESDALHDYAPLFLPDLDRIVDELEASGLQVGVPVLDLSTRTDGDEARVTVERFTVQVEGPGGEQTFEYDGRCFRRTGAGAGSTEPLCRNPDGPGSAMRMSLPPFALTAVEHDGAWYLSPTRTYLDSLLESLRGLDRDQVAEQLEESPFVLYQLLFPTFGFPSAFFSERVDVYECEALSMEPGGESSGGWFSYSPDAPPEDMPSRMYTYPEGERGTVGPERCPPPSGARSSPEDEGPPVNSPPTLEPPMPPPPPTTTFSVEGGGDASN